MLTGFDIQGDAWTWWDGAVGRYQRGMRPVNGSVLVFRRTGHLQYGHVATVSRVIDRRTILVDHSWLEGNVLHRGMKVVDTSPNNSWSSVRVWHDPSGTLGQRTFPTFGFIYPHGGSRPGMEAPLAVASRDDDETFGSAHEPRSRAAQSVASSASAHLVVLHPQHKPMMLAAVTPRQVPAPAHTVAAAQPAAPVQTVSEAPVILALASRHKPEAVTGGAHPVELSEVPQVAPRHKPGTHGALQVADASHAHGHDHEPSELGD